MARKGAGKSGKKAMPAAAEPKLKPVRLDLEPDVHRLLRLLSAYHGLSMAAFARDVLERHLREEAKGTGIRL